MTRFKTTLMGLGLCTLVTCFSLGTAERPASAQEARGVQAEAEAGVEVLTRGPIHEAFGKPVTFDAKPGIEVPGAPPEPIEEMPPDQKPEGDNVAWIPGYWAWSDDRDDFIWISGIWRVLPPGREWVPGYWQRSDDGHQWNSGFWDSVDKQEVEYLPPPPESLENGPSSETPSADHAWAPGSWMWSDTRYVWRPGYWHVCRPGWIWTPAHYVWTPGGCIYIDGYWDYSFRRRGIIFAPVYLDRVVYTRPAYYYSPSVVIDVDVVTDHFFCRPRYHHYYFGDFYASNYVDVGIVPWFSVHFSAGRHRYYDPVFTYYSWHYQRHDRGWVNRVRDDYRFRVNTERARPPRTFAAQQAVVRGSGNQVNQTNILAKNYTQVVNNTTIINNNTTNVTNQNLAITKFEKVDQSRRKEIVQQSKQVQQFKDKRRELEVQTLAGGAIVQTDKPGEAKAAKPGEARPTARPQPVTKPTRVALPKAQIAARPVRDVPKEKAPPPPPVVSKPDPQAKAKPSTEPFKPERVKPGKPQGRPADAKPIARPEKPERPKTDVKPEPKPTPRPEVKPRDVPKAEPKPKVEPRPEAKPRDVPKAEPKPAPKPEVKPREVPKVEPKPRETPKVESKPPRFEGDPRQQPKIERPATKEPPPKRAEEPRQQPKIERPATKEPPPKRVEEPRQQPKIERPPAKEPPPKRVEEPRQQPKIERPPAKEPPPKAERRPAPPADKAKDKEKDKEKEKDK